MLKNSKQVKESRLSDLKEIDYEFFMKQTGLGRQEIERILFHFNEKGVALNFKCEKILLLIF